MEDWADILLEFLGAQSVDEVRRTLHRHSDVLVSDVVDAQLAEFAVLGQARGEEFVRRIADRRRLLRRCREVGVERAVDEWSKPDRGVSRPPPAPRDLGSLVARLGELADPQHIPERIDLLEEVLPHLPASSFPAAWAALQYALADSVRKDQRGDPAENLERSIEALILLVGTVSGAEAPDVWATAQRDLGTAYLERRTGEGTDNVTRAIDHFQAGLDFVTAETGPQLWAELQHGRGEAYLRGAQDARPDDIELAIKSFHAAVTIFTRQSFPVAWSEVQDRLGIAYMQRPRGGRADNVERAIVCFESALAVPRHVISAAEWAASTHNLANAYRHRMAGDRAADLEAAISMYRQALTVRTTDAPRREWAETLTGLGSAYSERIAGDRAENIEQAIGCFDGALSVFTPEDHPAEWATSLHELATAYTRRIVGDRAANFEEAIRCSELALTVRTRASAPVDWAATQNNLGTAYLERIDGDRAGNVDRAILCLHNALEVFTPDRFPFEWAATLENLGVAYANTLTGPRTDAVERAIECFESARSHYATRGATSALAMAEHNLAAAYQDRTAGDRAENCEQAIRHYLAARKARPRNGSPAAWAMTEHNLGGAYLARINGVRADNVRAAIACLENALGVRTRNTAPFEWALSQAALGTALSDPPAGERDGDPSRAITCFRGALEVFGPRTFPYQCQHVARALGDTLASTGAWAEAAEVYRIALEAGDTLYRASVGRESKLAELGDMRGLHVRAADAMARAGSLGDAVVTLERGRARVLGDTLARDAADLAEVERRDPTGFAEYRRAADAIRALEAREVVASTLMLDATDDRVRRATAHELRREAEQAQLELDRAAERIRQIPVLADFLRLPSLADITGAVAPRTPIVFLAITDAGILTLVVKGGAGEAAVEVMPYDGATSKVTAADLDRLLVVRDGDIVVGGYLPGQAESDDEALETALDGLLPLLGGAIAPLASRLAALGSTGVILIPSGLLSLVPIHAAPLSDGSEQCLLDQLDVTYCPSTRVLEQARSRCRHRAASPRDDATLAGVGNPASARERGLPWAQIELEDVATYFASATSLVGTAATKEALVRAASRATYVHLACHGRFHPNAPLFSDIVLTGNDRLSLGDILRDRPFAAARMVVASGCNTGLTEFLNVPDEMVGLPAGLLQGGTPTVVGTLWRADDLSTALLMERFYRYHRVGDAASNEPQMSPARALRRAQRWLREVTAGELSAFLAARQEPATNGASADAVRTGTIEKAATQFAFHDPTDRPFAAPYHWAPFVLVGVGGWDD